MAKYEPTETLTWSANGVTMSQAMCAALLEFASYDDARPMLCGVAISDGCLAATDGHSLLRYDNPQCEPVKARNFDTSNVWARAHVERTLKVAKLDKTDVTLLFADLGNWASPPMAQVIPEPGFGRLVKGAPKDKGVTKQEPVALNPEYLARMVKVCKALGNKGCLLTSMRGELDPVMYTIGGRKGCDVNATVVIMPMRY